MADDTQLDLDAQLQKRRWLHHEICIRWLPLDFVPLMLLPVYAAKYMLDSDNKLYSVLRDAREIIRYAHCED